MIPFVGFTSTLLYLGLGRYQMQNLEKEVWMCDISYLRGKIDRHRGIREATNKGRLMLI